MSPWAYYKTFEHDLGENCEGLSVVGQLRESLQRFATIDSQRVEQQDGLQQ